MLALVGADVLAGELTAPDRSPAEAFRRSEVRMRPRAAAARKLLPGRVAMDAPSTRLGTRATTVLYSAVQSRPATAILDRFANRFGHDAALPAPLEP